MLQTPKDTPATEAVTAEIDISSDPRIEHLLREARAAYESDRLTTPIEDNAYLRYLQVLALESHEPRALAGLSEIVDKYLSWAMDEIDAGNPHGARDYLLKAKSVDEDHPNIPAVENQLQAMQLIRTRDYTITAEEIDALESMVPGSTDRLWDIARKIEETGANIIIYAPSDAAGRKIYQYLNNATTYRIKARFESSNLRQVRLLIH